MDGEPNRKINQFSNSSFSGWGNSRSVNGGGLEHVVKLVCKHSGRAPV